MLTEQQAHGLREYLSRNDVSLFLSRQTAGKARKAAVESLGFKIPAAVFKDAVEDTCRFWKKKRLKRVSPRDCLTDEEWDALRMAVSKLKKYIRDLTLDEATVLVRTRVSTNPGLLQGLSSRFHVWKQKPERNRNAGAWKKS